jgi:hypothetical protein
MKTICNAAPVLAEARIIGGQPVANQPAKGEARESTSRSNTARLQYWCGNAVTRTTRKPGLSRRRCNLSMKMKQEYEKLIKKIDKQVRVIDRMIPEPGPLPVLNPWERLMLRIKFLWWKFQARL